MCVCVCVCVCVHDRVEQQRVQFKVGAMDWGCPWTSASTISRFLPPSLGTNTWDCKALGDHHQKGQRKYITRWVAEYWACGDWGQKIEEHGVLGC